MTEDEARVDSRFPELVLAYSQALGPNHIHGADAAERFATRHILTGSPVLSVFKGDVLIVPGRPTETLAAPAARDPKRDPADGDVLEDDGWTYTVESVGKERMASGRSLIRYTVRWTYEGEAREEKRVKQLGAWRSLWRQTEERRQAATGSDRSVKARSEPVVTKSSAYASMMSAGHEAVEVRRKHGEGSPEHSAARAEVERLKAIWAAFPSDDEDRDVKPSNASAQGSLFA